MWIFIKAYFNHLCLLVFIIFISNTAFAQDELTEIKSFGQNPGNLRMFIFDKITSTNKPIPLIIALHGCNQDAIDFAELSGWNKIAQNQKFLVLYPQQKWTNNVSNCFNWFNSLDIDNKNGECFSIFEMICYVKSHYSIDTTQIFITGVSAGGAMSVALLANFPSIFNAGAIIAGGAYGLANNVIEGMNVMTGNIRKSNTELKELVTNLHTNDSLIIFPKIYIYQGNEDRIVAPKNANFLVSQWCGVHGIDTIADLIINNQLDSNVRIYTYQNSLQEPKVVLYLIDNLGHKLLISPGESPEKGGKIGFYGEKSNFHSTFQIAVDFKLSP